MYIYVCTTYIFKTFDFCRFERCTTTLAALNILNIFAEDLSFKSATYIFPSPTLERAYRQKRKRLSES